MRIELVEAAKGRGAALPPTSLAFESGEAVRVVVETEQRPTVVGLLASGRMRPDAGALLLDGEHGRRREVRHRTALVDAPRVSDPEPDVSLGGAIAEELLYAGVPGDPRSVRRWAAQLGVEHLRALPIADVEPAARIRVLAELAVLRDRVEAVVLVSPDRHGGDPRAWWAEARRLADRGFAVLVVCGEAADAVLRDDEAHEAAEAAAPAAPTHDEEAAA